MSEKSRPLIDTALTVLLPFQLLKPIEQYVAFQRLRKQKGPKPSTDDVLENLDRIYHTPEILGAQFISDSLKAFASIMLLYASGDSEFLRSIFTVASVAYALSMAVTFVQLANSINPNRK